MDNSIYAQSRFDEFTEKKVQQPNNEIRRIQLYCSNKAAGIRIFFLIKNCAIVSSTEYWVEDVWLKKSHSSG